MRADATPGMRRDEQRRFEEFVWGQANSVFHAGLPSLGALISMRRVCGLWIVYAQAVLKASVSSRWRGLHRLARHCRGSSQY
jgi:hypothetical protein